MTVEYVQITTGSDANVGADQLAGGEYVQYMKIMDGTANSEEVVGGDATNGLDVDVTRFPTDVAVAEDGALGKGLLLQGDDGSDRHNVQTDTNGYLKVLPQANSGVDIGDVDVTSFPPGNLGQQAIAASLSITPASNIPDTTYIGDIKFGESLPAGTNAIGKLAANSGVDIGDVDIKSLPADVAKNPVTTTEKGLLIQGDAQGTNMRENVKTYNGYLYVTGAEVPDSAPTAWPIRIAGKAASSEPTAVDNGDVVDALMTLAGKLVTLPYANPENAVSGTTGSTPITDDTPTEIIAAQGAGIKIYITEILVTNGDDATGTLVTIQDEDDNALWSGWAQYNGGGFAQTFRVPLVVPANKAIEAVCGTTAATVYVSVNGYVGA